MPTKVLNELLYCYQALNHAKALHQGAFAYYNVLSQLKHPKFNTAELNATRAVLLKLNALNKDLPSSKTFKQTEEERVLPIQDILATLYELEPRLQELTIEAKRLATAADQHTLKEEACLLAALHAFEVYSRDNYFRGLISLEEVLSDVSLADNGRAALETSRGQIEILNGFVKELQQDRPLERSIWAQLNFECRALSGTFRAYRHDIVQLLVGPSHEFTYANLPGNELAHTPWQEAGFKAVEAGYWQAYDISPEEALLWIGVEIESPQLAAMWHTASFPPPIAILWLEQGFPVFPAIQWHNAGYSPDIAAELVRAGYLYPWDVAEGELATRFPELFNNSDTLKPQTSQGQAGTTTTDSIEVEYRYQDPKNDDPA